MRVLVLHGYSGSALWQQRRDSLLQRLLAPLGVELHYADGPVLLSCHDDPEERRCCWWTSWERGSWEACVAYIASIFDSQGPFDGVMGYSEGAACAGALAAALQATTSLKLPHFRFAIMASGYLPRDPAVLKLFPLDESGQNGRTFEKIPCRFSSGTSDSRRCT